MILCTEKHNKVKRKIEVMLSNKSLKYKCKDLVVNYLKENRSSIQLETQVFLTRYSSF